MSERDPYYDDEDEDEKSVMNYYALAAIVAIVVIGFVVVWEIRKETHLQSCYSAEARNCQTSEQSSQ